MGSENDYDIMAAEGTTIDQERAEYHLRCLGVDCGWRAGEVEDFIKDREAAMKAVCTEVGTRGATIMQQAARIAELEATERELREAVKVLATYAHRRTLQAQKLDTMPYIKQQVFLGTVGQAKDAVLANPIAAAAVREASK